MPNKSQQPHLSVMVIGKASVGKSTLISSIKKISEDVNSSGAVNENIAITIGIFSKIKNLVWKENL